MNCEDCKKRLYPENPEISVYDKKRKRWLPPLCQGCPLEAEKLEPISPSQTKLWAAVNSLRGQAAYLQYQLAKRKKTTKQNGLKAIEV